MLRQNVEDVYFTIKTTKQTSFSITILCSTYNRVTAYWGDGTSTVVSGATAMTKTWANPGEKTVTITGELDKITYIICANQQVTEVNLNSELINVNGLSFDRNADLIELIIPDECTKLTAVSIYSSGICELVLPNAPLAFGALNAYSCPNLTKIDARYAVSCYTRLYAYDCPSLEIVDFRNAIGNIPYLYVYNNPELTELRFAFTSCSAFIYVYNCPLLTVCDFSSVLGSLPHFYAYNTGLSEINISFGSCFRFRVENNQNVTSVNAASLTSCSEYLYAYNCTKLESLNISNLAGSISEIQIYNTAISSFSSKLTSVSSSFYLRNCVNLSTVDVSTVTTCGAMLFDRNPLITPPSIAHFTNASQINFQSCGLTQGEVDAVLAECVIIAASDTSCILNLSNSTGSPNAAPSASGLADVATLRGIGWTVFHA